jgi:uncharacterized membrane protein
LFVEVFVRASQPRLIVLRAVRRATAVALTSALLIAASAPVVRAADTVTLTTPYPAVVVSPGSKVSFDLTVKTTPAARVDLEVVGAPSGWTAILHGGGFVIDAVETDGKDAATARLDVSVPADASGTTHLTVTATALGQTVILGLDLRAEAAGGDVTLATDFPSLKGASDATFTFNLTLSNDTAQDLTFVVNAQGPDGWTVDAKLTGEAQAASAIVKAGSSSGVSVTAKPPDGIDAGKYPVQVVASAGAKEIKQDLEVEVTGSFSMSMSTPDQVLSAHGSTGSVTEQQITITNSGTADLTNVTIAATPPTNWKVDFDKPTIDSIAAGKSETVTAKITPSGDAIAGDYQITFRASSDQSSASEDIRFTVETSFIWAIVGIALIIAVFAGLWWVFQRYGRR